jgi:DNA-binding NarL/FixJ family response regulator
MNVPFDAIRTNGAVDRNGRAQAISRGAPRVVVFSTSAVVGHGLIGLLPSEWRERATIVSDVRALERPAAVPHQGAATEAAIIDLDTPGAAGAIRAVRAAGGSLVVLLGSGSHGVDPALLEETDAILLREEVDSRTLRMALAAGSVGMRLVPRALPPGVSPKSGGDSWPLGESARRVLTLLAEGMRDAEMARALNLSTSAVRKLVQRTVHGMGARTRSQAVVMPCVRAS